MYVCVIWMVNLVLPWKYHTNNRRSPQRCEILCTRVIFLYHHLRPIRMYFLLYYIVFVMRHNLQWSIAKRSYIVLHCDTWWNNLSDFTCPRRHVARCISILIWTWFAYKYLHSSSLVAQWITRLSGVQEDPRSNPTLGKNFSLWNSRLFRVPHSATMQLQMKSTVAYT